MIKTRKEKNPALVVSRGAAFENLSVFAEKYNIMLNIFDDLKWNGNVDVPRSNVSIIKWGLNQ